MTYWITEAPGGAEPFGGENGRSVLPNGIIIMWGKFTDSGDFIRFHTPFPNNCFAVNYTGSTGEKANLKITGKNREGFNITNRYRRRSRRAETDWEHIRYVAIGN